MSAKGIAFEKARSMTISYAVKHLVEGNNDIALDAIDSVIDKFSDDDLKWFHGYRDKQGLCDLDPSYER